MTFRMLSIGFVSGFMLAVSTVSHAAERLGWEDLDPVWQGPANPFDGLNEERQSDLADILWLRDLEKDGGADKESIAIAVTARRNLDAAGLDANELIAASDGYMKYWRLHGDKLVEGLDGKDIRLPGYVLPLEFAGGEVREFLLVPYVGACIHSPPPPANQIVHVRTTEAFETEGLFAPVWVTGRISTSRSSQNLSLVDGSSDISVGYNLEASKVEPYTD